MYELAGKIATRGFYLERAGKRVFATSHKFGILQNSTAIIGNDKITVKARNLLGEKFTIQKNGFKIGHIDLTSYLYSKISLNRTDGTVDVFKLEERGFSQIHVLSHLGEEVIKFTVSLNPLRLVEFYKVEVLSDKFAPSAVEELMYYAGEILFRQVGSSAGARL